MTAVQRCKVWSTECSVLCRRWVKSTGPFAMDRRLSRSARLGIRQLDRFPNPVTCPVPFFLFSPQSHSSSQRIFATSITASLGITYGACTCELLCILRSTASPCQAKRGETLSLFPVGNPGRPQKAGPDQEAKTASSAGPLSHGQSTPLPTTR